MDKNIIEYTFNQVFKKYATKCHSTTKRNIQALTVASQKYGLLEVTGDTSGSMKIYKDEKNDTIFDFTNAFVDKDIIDFTNSGQKKIDLEKIFEAYENLPTKVKKDTHIIKFSVEDDRYIEDVLNGAIAWSGFIDPIYNETKTVIIPSSSFDKYLTKDGEYSLERVIAHEGMHCHDYPHPTKKTMNLINQYLHETETGNALDWNDRMKVFKYIEANGKKKFTKTFGYYQEAVQKNKRFISENGLDPTINKASDYGARDIVEDYAEAGSMIICGYKNPDNPNAVITINGEKVPYRNWVATHPYQAQALIKDLFGDKVSIKELNNMAYNPRYRVSEALDL